MRSILLLSPTIKIPINIKWDRCSVAERKSSNCSPTIRPKRCKPYSKPHTILNPFPHTQSHHLQCHHHQWEWAWACLRYPRCPPCRCGTLSLTPGWQCPTRIPRPISPTTTSASTSIEDFRVPACLLYQEGRDYRACQSHLEFPLRSDTDIVLSRRTVRRLPGRTVCARSACSACRDR